MRVLTAEERKKMVSILRGAKRRLSLEKGSGVCSAIIGPGPGDDEKGSGAKGAETYKSVLYLMAWVDSMLGSQPWLTSWLASRGFLGEENEGKSHYYMSLTDTQERKLLATRKAWIDWMIKELREGR